MTRRAVWGRAVAAAVVGAAMAAGCSSSGDSPSPSSSVSVSPSGPQTYTDAQFGYSFGYAPPFAIVDGAGLSVTAGNPADSMVAVMDGSGPQLEGAATNGWMVTAYSLAQPVTSANLETARAELEQNIIPALTKQGYNVGPLTAKTVAGSPAFAATATATAGKDKVRSMLYFVFDGSTQYQIITQASDDTWSSMQPTFDKFLSSFTIPAAPSSSSTPSSVSSSPSS